MMLLRILGHLRMTRKREQPGPPQGLSVEMRLNKSDFALTPIKSGPSQFVSSENIPGAPKGETQLLDYGPDNTLFRSNRRLAVVGCAVLCKSDHPPIR
jgi:hypothetical protein